MKKINFLTIMSVSIFSMFALNSCNNLDLHYEGGTQDLEQIIQANRVDAALNGMYAWMSTPLSFFGVASNRADDIGYPGLCLSEDLNSGDMVNIVTTYDWFTVALEYSDRTSTYANPRMRFGLPYKILYSAKEALEVLPDTTTVEMRAKLGQIKAMRAFAYLSLAPYFQFKYKGNQEKPSVPLMVDNVEDSRNNPRASLRDLYSAIIKDLTEAIEDFDGWERSNKGQIDQQVAYGLRARAYMYMEEWDKAAADADKALAGYTPYSIAEAQKPAFVNANDHNVIWAVLCPSDIVGVTRISWPSQICSFTGMGYTTLFFNRCINNLLFDKIPTTDVRKGWWLDENAYSPNLNGLNWVWTDPDSKVTTTFSGQDIVSANIPDVKAPMDPYSNIKFGQRSGIGSESNDNDWILMRAEEMILIKAEATAKAGNLAGGKQILENFVKTYRNPSFTSTAISIDAFSNEIFLQRRIELWGEGFTMADIMRLGKNVVRYHPGAATNVPEPYQFNIAANDPWILLRFPQSETTNNLGIIQNEGGTQPKQGDGASLLDGVTD